MVLDRRADGGCGVGSVYVFGSGRMLLRSAGPAGLAGADERDDAAQAPGRAIAERGFRILRIWASNGANRWELHNRRIMARRCGTMCTRGSGLFADMLRQPCLPADQLGGRTECLLARTTCDRR